DANGNKLDGDNQQFSFRHEMTSIPQEPKAAAKQLLTHFKQIVKQGVIKLESVASNVKSVLAKIAKGIE
ncbi:MAG: hypothetical protein FD138_2086, partial [Planctomycetota bacterium]